MSGGNEMAPQPIHSERPVARVNAVLCENLRRVCGRNDDDEEGDFTRRWCGARWSLCIQATKRPKKACVSSHTAKQTPTHRTHMRSVVGMTTLEVANAYAQTGLHGLLKSDS